MATHINLKVNLAFCWYDFYFFINMLTIMKLTLPRALWYPFLSTGLAEKFVSSKFKFLCTKINLRYKYHVIIGTDLEKHNVAKCACVMAILEEVIKRLTKRHTNDVTKCACVAAILLICHNYDEPEGDNRYCEMDGIRCILNVR